jgi:peptide deformylase
MAVLAIRRFGDPVLRSKADPVVQFDAALVKLAADMTETMRAAPGVGLAAPQVGVPRRVFVFDSAEQSGALCNPEIVWRSEETQTGEEGCLSVPDLYFPVTRAMSVRVRASDESGAPVEIEGSELLARIFQHEIDHLDGILFIDRLDSESRREAMRIIREAELTGVPPPPPASKARAL